MGRALRRLRHRIGHRGATLIFFGLLDLIFCASLLFPAKQDQQSDQLKWLADILPLWAWGLVWGGVGVVCLWYAPRRRDHVGFAAAIGLKVLWGLVSLAGWLVGDAERGWVSVLVWLGFAYLVRVIASWPEPINGKGRPAWTPPSGQP